MAEATKTRSRRPATYADLEAVPPHLVAEILGGELVTHPRPMPRHALAHSALIGEIDGPFQKARAGGPGGWIFMTEPQLHLGEHVVVPDIAGWRRERLKQVPDTVGVSLPPDWVAEVLSPSTARYDRTIKFAVYHQFEIGHLWYVDPINRTLEVFGWSADHWVPKGNFGDFDEVSAPPFDAITFNLGQLWPFDEPPTPEN